METIKVNMNPNPLDVQTIHASQNDGEARQWGFELHNNGDAIDSSEITDQMVFKAYKGGTEQILPENGSTPTTSPFKGDIKYPQGLLSDQEFTYRQSPTEEDGLAFIESIKGNTLAWNQLFNTIPTSSTDGITTEYNATTHLFSITNNNRTSNYSSGSTRGNLNFSLVGGHKYFIRSNKDILGVVMGESGSILHALNSIFTAVVDYATPYIRITYQYDFVTAHPVGDVTSFYFNVFDLTAMGLDSLTEDEFTSLFPLPYYDYNQGTLIPFSGNGIKTVGKNQIKLSADNLVSSQRIGINYLDNGAVFTANGTYSRAGYTCKTIKGQQYTLSFKGSSNGNFGAVYISNDLDWSTNYGRIILSTTETNKSLTFTADSELFFVGFYLTNTGTSGSMTIKDIQLELGSSVTSYVPFVSSIADLPISQYFPNGMDGVGTDYDELTNTKATTRMTRVDLGTLDWGVSNGTMYANLPNAYLPSTAATVANAICPKYTTSNLNYVINKSQDKILALNNAQPRVNIYDSAYTDAVAFKTAMSGVYLVYPLATPTETSFTTASLVTENAEIPLSNEDGVLIGKCTEELSAEPGFHDAKIKLSDADGECYSNKLQLHIERSPQ